MDAITVLLIVLAVVVIAGAAFAVIRSRQRSGSVLAAPKSDGRSEKAR